MKNIYKKIALFMLSAVMTAGLIFVNKEVTLAATATATVTGTVAKGTTADTLYLNASEGTYTIKLDNETNFNDCKVLTVGKQITVGIYRGSDPYNHAATITSGKKTNTVNVDTTNRATVSGTVLEKSTDETLYLQLPEGEMVIKLDSTTDYSGCKVVVAGAKLNVVVGRGEDATMHAISISSGYGTSSDSQASSSVAPSGTVAVTGTPEDKSTPNELYLKTKDGTYYLKIDSSSDTSGGFVFTSGNTVTAYIYRGDDASMHAAKVVGTRNTAGTVGSSTTTFSGTVEKDSTETTLLLNTNGGVMKFKLDNGTSLSGAKALTKGLQVTVSGSVGSDSYWHAVSISAKYDNTPASSSSSTADLSNTIAVTGTPEDKSTSDTLYLKTKDGTYYLKIDDSSDTTGGFVFTSGNTLTAYIYRGTDASMHAAKVVGTRNTTGTVGSSTTTFSGTVESGSTETTLLLKTSGGTMKFKLDSGTILVGAKGLSKGKTVTVSGASGSDSYWHAKTITVK